MYNISIDWIPSNINNESDGSHNGDNYIAYTFYVANQGNESIDYWYSIIIDDVIKNVDEAVRVMIFLNDEKTVYAKKNSYTGMEEKDTNSFWKLYSHIPYWKLCSCLWVVRFDDCNNFIDGIFWLFRHE